jgi:hypothetical protein
MKHPPKRIIALVILAICLLLWVIAMLVVFWRFLA